MTTRIIIVALMLCTNFIVHAQVEDVAIQLAENEYIKFADELPNALAKGNATIFKNARALKKQFFLEENANVFADFLGWDKKKYSQKTLGSVFLALSEKSKPENLNPVSVTFDFPAQPTESNATVPIDKKSASKKTAMVSYVVTTKANVTVEVSKNGQTSIAYSNITLVWDGRLRLVNGEVDDKQTMTAPILRTIIINPVDNSSEPKEPKEEPIEDKFVAPEVTAPPVVIDKPTQKTAEVVTETVINVASQPALPPPPPPPVQSSKGEHYKVQFLLLHSYVSPADLPQKFKVENTIVERYSDGQNTYYKYVVPVNSFREALALRDQLVERGIDDAWIAVYENEERVRPLQGQPENIQK